MLPEDGWRQRVEGAGFSLLSPKQWYLREGIGREPSVDRECAEQMVDRVMQIANVTSSSNAAAVREAAIARRL